MIYNYIFIGMLLLGAIAFAMGPLLLVAIVAPRKRSGAKYDTYECGLLTTGETWVRFRIQYYIYAMMFVVFDIETVFIYPWSVQFRSLGWTGLTEMFGFLAVIVVALIYVWKKGALEWEQ